MEALTSTLFSYFCKLCKLKPFWPWCQRQPTFKSNGQNTKLLGPGRKSAQTKWYEMNYQISVKEAFQNRLHTLRWVLMPTLFTPWAPYQHKSSPPKLWLRPFSTCPTPIDKPESHRLLGAINLPRTFFQQHQSALPFPLAAFKDDMFWSVQRQETSDEDSPFYLRTIVATAVANYNLKWMFFTTD